jgi:hypothetical protein
MATASLSRKIPLESGLYAGTAINTRLSTLAMVDFLMSPRLPPLLLLILPSRGAVMALPGKASAYGNYLEVSYHCGKHYKLVLRYLSIPPTLWVTSTSSAFDWL